MLDQNFQELSMQIEGKKTMGLGSPALAQDLATSQGNAALPLLHVPGRNPSDPTDPPGAVVEVPRCRQMSGAAYQTPVMHCYLLIPFDHL